MHVQHLDDIPQIRPEHSVSICERLDEGAGEPAVFAQVCFAAHCAKTVVIAWAGCRYDSPIRFDDTWR